jgi:nucleotide-binding universal stress UspA family protein
MDLATSLARREESELLIAHVWSLYGETLLRGGFGRTDEEEVDRLLQETEAEHRRRLDVLLGKYELQDLAWQPYLLKGDAGRIIPALAREKKADLIVMGTLSRSGIAGFLIGNTAEKTLQNVECSVLAVKPDGFVSPVKVD